MFCILAKPPVNKDSSQEHAFDTGGRVETTTTAEVLHDLRRNSQDTSGTQTNDVLILSKDDELLSDNG